MARRRKSRRQQQLEALILAPVNWLDERDPKLLGGVRYFLFRKVPRETNWLVGVIILTLALFEGLTGYLLPWDQTSYWATVVAININANAPIVGPFLGDFLRGGTEIGENTLSIFYSFHMLLIPGGLIALITLHLYLVVRLGVTPPPWSEVAAGYEETDGRPARVGLVEPRPRGDGAMGQPPREKGGPE